MKNRKKGIFISIISIIYFSFSGMAQTGFHHWEMMIEANQNWRYFEGTQEPPANWREILFNDNSWNTGPAGIGYGDGDDSTIISPVNSLYMRRVFTISNPSDLLGALLYIDYDDAFVAYLNGIEIARSNIGVPGIIPLFDTYADNNTHEAQMYQGGKPEGFLLYQDEIDTILVQGNNVLA
ncbi:MAG: hypothetical protein U9R19_17825, partial [Bacteroidota bacterium]|nr:hypothetical protein [Bacteroidota bacterium]